MAYSVLKIRENYYDPDYKEFIIDTDDELTDLPGLEGCAAGSEAYSIESGKTFVLSNDGEWVEKAGAGASADGKDGVTFTPSVSNAGVISWTNDGELENPTSVDLLAALRPAVTAVSGTTPSIALADNIIFSTGELTSLTVTGSLNEGETCVIIFTSGSTATQLIIPATIKMPDSFAVEANKVYEISIMGNRGVVQSWPTT